ncbi:unnamed protein product [Cuscuta campestris]|uniref:Replication factor A C-terminal domain-containing protein n=1 Tax=Cuscuta campestris TaxID=132261 RepID=A0A484KZH0_9ASTE|nr:unnamed protein product [Cuscuta campestris]
MFAPIADLDNTRKSWILMLSVVRVYFVPRGNRLGCTLWGEYVDRFIDCLTQNNQEPVIMHLSFCRPRRYMGTVTVSTAFHVTKILFDGNSPEVEEFRARLPPQVENGMGMGSIVLSGGDVGDQGVIKTTTIKALLDNMKSATKRYKISVQVYDHTGHASFVLWDRECKEILGACVFVLREIMLEKEMDPNFVPLEQNRFLGRKGLFHVVLKAELGSPS